MTLRRSHVRYLGRFTMSAGVSTILARDPLLPTLRKGRTSWSRIGFWVTIRSRFFSFTMGTRPFWFQARLRRRWVSVTHNTAYSTRRERRKIRKQIEAREQPLSTVR